MLIAVAEISMISWCTTYAVLSVAYIFRPDVYFIGDIFSRARFPGRDSILRSRGWGQTPVYRGGVHYIDRCFDSRGTEQTSVRGDFFKAPQGILLLAALKVG